MTVRVTPVPVVTVVTLWHTKDVQQKKRRVNCHSQTVLKDIFSNNFSFLSAIPAPVLLEGQHSFLVHFSVEFTLNNGGRGDDPSPGSHQAVKSALNVAIILYSRVCSVKTAGDEVTMNQFLAYCA